MPRPAPGFSSREPRAEHALHNCYAVHTLRYEALPAYLFLIALRDDTTATWAAWDTVERTAATLNLPTVPILWRGALSSEADLQALTERLMTAPGCYGPTREGVVVRLAGEFVDFPSSICKCVREGHVQTDAHWLNRSVEKQPLRSKSAGEKPGAGK